MVIFVLLLVMLAFSKAPKIIFAVILGTLLILAPIGWHFLKTYQKERIITFINPSSDPYGSGYNVTQAKITVGSGGLLGQGIGKGTQIQLNFLPVAHTDFIFASTAEALGFIGSTILLILFGFLVIRIFSLAHKAKDSFGFYLAIGWGFVLLFQVFVNVGMNLGIMPVTGIPLPFVSSGGSSMFTNMAAIGIMQSIYLRHRRISF
jgi:rod shape determining protein RodA